jgi:hypothetical protein
LQGKKDSLGSTSNCKVIYRSATDLVQNGMHTPTSRRRCKNEKRRVEEKGKREGGESRGDCLSKKVWREGQNRKRKRRRDDTDCRVARERETKTKKTNSRGRCRRGRVVNGGNKVWFFDGGGSGRGIVYRQER